MKAHYEIISEEFGKVTLRRRKIAKSLRWWLRENGLPCDHRLIIS